MAGILPSLLILFTVTLATHRLAQGYPGLTREQTSVLAALLPLAVLNSAWPGMQQLLRDSGASGGPWVTLLSLAIAAFAVWVGSVRK